MGKKKKNSNYLTKGKQDKLNAAAAMALAAERRKKRNNVIAVILLCAVIFAVAILIISPWNRPVYVRMTVKDHGEMIIRLDPKSAPKTVDNFVTLTESGFYDGLTFFRSQDNFVIQGGKDTETYVKNIYGEFSSNGYRGNNIKHGRGVISMARSGDPNSATSQFFICTATNDTVTRSLDGNYAAFGIVVEGLEVIDLIADSLRPYAGSGSGFVNDVEHQVVIEKVELLGDYVEK